MLPKLRKFRNQAQAKLEEIANENSEGGELLRRRWGQIMRALEIYEKEG